LVADRLELGLKKSFVIENRPGATGNIGTAAVVNAKPDGCTLLVNAAVIATFSLELHQARIRSGQGFGADRRDRRDPDPAGGAEIAARR
jgi:tripartite-type tricarboxylate transporter receptor subunit TctC